MSATYLYKPTAEFARKLERIQFDDPPGHARILKVIDRLLENPDDADGTMHGRYRGRLKKYVGRNDYRLIYAWCHLCLKANKKYEAGCQSCEAISDNSVIFFDLYHKGDSTRVYHGW